MNGELVIHPHLGGALPGRNWIPAPRYLLRRHRILSLLKDVPPGRVLEIGCGSGALLRDLGARGWSGYGLERSPDALELARLMNSDDGPMRILAEPPETWTDEFDLVLACEVLEHIEDDAAALADWSKYVAPGGRLIISAPSRPELWNAADDWAGHVRRYKRPELAARMTGTGFELERIESYGWPLANIMEPLRARAYGRQLREADRAGLDPAELTLKSGTDRRAEARAWPLLSSWLGVLALRAACRLQEPFLGGDRGNGYIAVARRPATE